MGARSRHNARKQNRKCIEVGYVNMYERFLSDENYYNAMTMAGKHAYAMWDWYQMSQIEVREQAMGRGDRLHKFHGRCHLATTQG